MILPGRSIYQDHPRCSNYGETLHFEKRIGIVSEIFENTIFIKFDDSDFKLGVNYNYTKSRVCIDPTRM